MKIHPNTPNYIGVEFKVWAPKLTRVTKKLYLLGSLKELGAWNIDKALRAFSTTDMHVWSVEVSLPAMCHFEWVWLTTNMNRSQVEWEKATKRNRTVDCFSGTLHTVWGESDEVFLQSATSLQVTTFVRVKDDYTLVLTGSTPSTGEWNLHYAKPATEFPKRSGYWKVNVAFDALTNLEFKWAIVSEKDQGVLRVQEKKPHSIFGRKSWISAVAPWNTPTVIVVDTSLLCDLTDTKQGRTDLIVMERKRRAEEIREWLLKSEEERATPQTDKSNVKQKSNPVEKTASISSYSKLDQPAKTDNEAPPIPTFSNLNMTSTRRTPSLEEHIKNTEQLTRSEKLIQQLYMRYSEEPPVHAIKGKGQKQLPSDRMNIGRTPVDSIEELSVAYGEVAEITSKHIPVCSNPVRQRIKCHFVDTRESLRKDTWERQKREELDSKTMKSYSSPVMGVWENQPPKGINIESYHGGNVKEEENQHLKAGTGVLENDCNEETSQPAEAALDITPAYVKSQSGLETMPSDTGFADMSSMMSSGKMDGTGSESNLLSSNTITYVLPGDANNLTDTEESRSDDMTLQTHTLSNKLEGEVSFWESRQTDLTPPWLDKDRLYIQDGGGDLLSDHLSANEEDNEHFDWLVSRIEDDYPIFSLDTYNENSPDYSLDEDTFLNGADEEDKPELDSKIEQARFILPCSSKLSQVNYPTFKFTRICESDNLPDNDATVSYSGDFDSLYASDLTPYRGINVGAEAELSTERRRFARHLEEHWVSSCHSPESCQMESVPESQFPPLKNVEAQNSVVSAFADGVRGLTSTEGTICKMAYYSYSEMSDVLIPEADTINHREKAREIEQMWGNSQVNEP